MGTADRANTFMRRWFDRPARAMRPYPWLMFVLWVEFYAALSVAAFVSAAFDLMDWKRDKPVLTLEALNEILEDE